MGESRERQCVRANKKTAVGMGVCSDGGGAKVKNHSSVTNNGRRGDDHRSSRRRTVEIRERPLYDDRSYLVIPAALILILHYSVEFIKIVSADTII